MILDFFIFSGGIVAFKSFPVYISYTCEYIYSNINNNNDNKLLLRLNPR